MYSIAKSSKNKQINILMQSKIINLQLYLLCYRIELIRQKSPRSQIRKYSSILKKYGYNIDNVIDSPPRTNDSIALYRALNVNT